MLLGTLPSRLSSTLLPTPIPTSTSKLFRTRLTPVRTPGSHIFDHTHWVLRCILAMPLRPAPAWAACHARGRFPVSFRRHGHRLRVFCRSPLLTSFLCFFSLVLLTAATPALARGVAEDFMSLNVVAYFATAAPFSLESLGAFLRLAASPCLRIMLHARSLSWALTTLSSVTHSLTSFEERVQVV